MQKRYGQITGWGAYTPPNILTNQDLEKLVDTNHDWIVRRTGIHQRHIVGPEDTTGTMSVAAGRAALEKANLDGTDLDLIILATTFQDHVTPPTSSLVQHMLGAHDVPAFVLTTGCTGFVYALSVAQQFISTGAYRTILIIGTEVISRALDWTDRSTCVLFGDASAAMVMEACDEPCGLFGFDLGSDGSGYDKIIIPAGGAVEPVGADTFATGRHYLQMNGREVFKFASRVLGQSCHRSLEKAGMSLDEIDWIVPHQANLRIIQAAARDMNLPLSRFITVVDRYGNTSAASIPLAICDAIAEGQIKPEDKLMLVSFGAGLTWASGVLQMAPKQEGVPAGMGSLTAVSPAVTV
jgi:3-oxoacyl-[acyl-carrier-protein] synthase-3